MVISDAVRRCAEFIAGQHEVGQVYVVGSASTASTDEHSDIDFLAVCSKRPSATSRLRYYRQHLPGPRKFHTFNLKSWEFGTSDSFDFADAPICIMYYTAAELDKKISDVVHGNGQPHGFYQPTGFLNALRSATLIASPSSAPARSPFAELKSFPQQLRQEIIRRTQLEVMYFLEASQVGLRRGDYFYAQQCLFHLRASALSLTFALARRYRASDKRMAAELWKR